MQITAAEIVPDRDEIELLRRRHLAEAEERAVEMASLRHSVLDEVTKLTDATHQAQTNSRRAPASAETSRKVLDSLKEELTAELTTTQRQAAAAAARAKEALNHADTLAERMGEERQSQHKEVIGQLGQMKQTEATTSAKVVSGTPAAPMEDGLSSLNVTCSTLRLAPMKRLSLLTRTAMSSSSGSMDGRLRTPETLAARRFLWSLPRTMVRPSRPTSR